jgi:chromosome partitioning protein
MRIIAIVNQKGGVGKTTVSINLASALAELNQRTLLVDMDPQSHCAVGLAVPEEQIEQSVYDVFISHCKNEPIRISEILWQINNKLELAPSSIDLSAFEQQMVGVAEREMCLKNVLDGVKNDYDYVVVDCPPAVSLLTFNALRAATDVVVPVETGYFSLHGLSKQLDTLNVLCQRTNQQVNVGIVASMYDIRTKMAREILAELRNHFGNKMFKTVVNFNTKLKEAASFGQPISEYDPSSKGRSDFRSLAQELISMDPNQKRFGMVNTLASQLEAISTSADDLLKASKPAAQPVQVHVPQQIVEAPPAVKPAAEQIVPLTPPKQETKTIDEKISDYYGVSQVNDAVMFVTLYPRAANVAVAGDFNNWQPTQACMEKVGESGIWQAKLNLPKGKYHYKFVVDGQWQQDPYNAKAEPNPYGELNSVLEVV